MLAIEVVNHSFDGSFVRYCVAKDAVVEALLKRVCGELVEGVREYREDFEPDADALIEKFADIQNNGYEAFVKYSLSDVKVKNAVINALYDEMEQAQEDAARRIEADAAAEE